VRAGPPLPPPDYQGFSGIPTNGDCEVVWDYITGPYRRPVTADIGPEFSLPVVPPPGPGVGIPWGFGYIFPPWPKPEPVIINNMVPRNPETEAAVIAELTDMMRNETEPGMTMLLSKYYVAIGNAPGVEEFELLAPVANVTTQPGEIVTLGPVTFLPP
jgi:hypothetical protein